MSCFIDFIDINLWEKYTLTNLVSAVNGRSPVLSKKSERIFLRSFFF